MELKEQFEARALEWAEHCSKVRFSSILADYLDHPAYREIVRLGPAVIPWIIEHYRIETLPWGFALQEITGIQMIANPNEFSPSGVRRRWLEWWQEQADGSSSTAQATHGARTVEREDP